jgi:AcrR family transcriptional regulator
MSSTGPDPLLPTRQEQRRMTHARITLAARTVFERDGYNAASIGDIAAAANVNRVTFYQHFPDKAAALNQVYADIAAEAAKYWSRLDHILTDGTPAAMRELLSTAMRWWDEHRAILPAIHEAMATDLGVAATWKSVLDGLATELHPYLEDFPTEEHEDMRLRIQLLVVQLDQTFFRYIVQGVFDIEREHLIDLLTDIWCATLRLSPSSASGPDHQLRRA